jgi:hypothetical protein
MVINNWPFPTEVPPKPWTPEDHKRWAEEQLKNMPPSPFVSFV